MEKRMRNGWFDDENYPPAWVWKALALAVYVGGVVTALCLLGR